jgi:hypothetical protein
MQATEGRVVGPDGPEIILEPVGNSLQWKVGGTPVIEGNGATIVPGDISTCVLRDDFIGQKKLHFKYIKQGEAGSRLAKVVVLENDDYRLEIRENSLKQLQWTLKDKANSTACVLTPSGQFAYPVKLPEPLMSFTTSDGFNEVQYNHPIATLTLQGQMPPL